jgi:hypothetical protein
LCLANLWVASAGDAGGQLPSFHTAKHLAHAHARRLHRGAPSPRRATAETLPALRVVLYPNFIDGARCSHIVELAKGKLEASGLAWRPDETPDPGQQTRTSDGAFLSAAEDHAGVLAWLERKIAAVTMLPVHHGEVRCLGGRGLGGHVCTLQGRHPAGQAAAQRSGPPRSRHVCSWCPPAGVDRWRLAPARAAPRGRPAIVV